ncbi:MAG: DNA polymerase III subunit beta [Alphaproteobacteria bacterium]
MHVTLEKSTFLKSLAHQQGVIERKTTVPILSHVLLTAKAGKLTLTGTDLELCLVESIDAQVEAPGQITLPVHTLYDIVRKLKDNSPITLRLEENGTICLDCSPSVFNLPTLPTIEFPAMNAQSLPHQFTLACRDLRRLIDQTRFAMSSEEARYYLNGVYFHHLDGQLRAVATDAHRLALSWMPIPETAKNMPGVILSRKTIQEIRKLIDGKEEDILHIALSGQQISFTLGESVLYSRLIEGQFPDYQRAIPQQGGQDIFVENRFFAEAVDRVSMISQEKSRIIKMQLASSQITLSAQSAENGFAEENLPIDYQGNPLSIGFNARYMLDISQQMTGDRLNICLNEGQTPVLLKDPQEHQALYVLMPMRV